MTTKERQDILSEFYRFKCSCSLCLVVPSNDDDDDDIQTDNNTMSRVSSTWTIETKQKTKRNTDYETALPSSSSSTFFLPSFEKWCLDPTFPDDILINAHIRALQFIEQDNDDDDDDYYHHHQLTRDTDIKHLDAIAMCYGALEDADNFRKWMERVREVRSRVNPRQKLVCSKWLSNPTTFPVWGWRRVFCGEEEDEGDATTSGSGEDSDSGLSTCVSMGMFNYI